MQQFEQRFKAGFTTVMGVRMHAANLVHGACSSSSSSSFFMAERRDVEFEPRASLIMEHVRGLKLVHSSGHKRKAGIPARELLRPALLISLWHRPKPCSLAGAAQQGCSGLARQPASSFMVLTVHSFPLPSYSYSFIPRLYEYCIFYPTSTVSVQPSKHTNPPPPPYQIKPQASSEPEFSIKMQRLNKSGIFCIENDSD
jgi:hypothetical protein